MSAAVSSDELGRLAHTAAAQFRAGVARTPAERAAVDWAAVVVDVNAGITADWALVSDCNALNFCDDALTYRTLPGWNMMANWVLGMADQSGAYQTWMAAPLPDKMPFIMVTPDTRFPQGVDETTQLGTAGTYYEIASGADRIWDRPDRGTWRWSSYRYDALDDFAVTGVGAIPLFTTAEMRFLLAEAAYRSGDAGTAASIVNETRTAHGLQGTDAGGTNTDCVPMLPDGSCGDLWEMLKWEKRLETHFRGVLRIGWYFDGRGWGDLIEGTPLMLPVPYQEMVLRGQLPYDFGGVGGLWGAPIGTYGY
jgi:hypothetical protein